MKIIISSVKQMRVDTDLFVCDELPVFLDKSRKMGRSYRKSFMPKWLGERW